MPRFAVASETVSDQELVRGYQETGNEQLLEALIGRYRVRIMAFIESRNLFRESDDVFQEVQIAVAKGIRKCDASRSITSWLFGIAAHKIADAHRRQYRRPPDVPLSTFEHPDDMFALEEEDPALIVADAEEAENNVRLLREGVRALRDDDQRYIQERFIQEKRNKVVAAERGISEQDVANKVFDAKQKLKKMCMQVLDRRAKALA